MSVLLSPILTFKIFQCMLGPREACKLVGKDELWSLEAKHTICRAKDADREPAAENSLQGVDSHLLSSSKPLLKETMDHTLALFTAEEKEKFFQLGRTLRSGLRMSLTTLCSGTDACVDLLKDLRLRFRLLQILLG